MSLPLLATLALSNVSTDFTPPRRLNFSKAQGLMGPRQLAKIAVESGNVGNFCKINSEFHQLCNGDDDTRSKEFWAEVLDLTWGVQKAKKEAPHQLIYPKVQHKKLYDLYLTIINREDNFLAVYHRFLELIRDKEYDRAFQMYDDGILDHYTKDEYHLSLRTRFFQTGVNHIILKDPDNTYAIQRFLSFGVDPNYAFEMASRAGKINVVKYLVEQVGLNVEDNKAFEYAALRGHLNVLKYLVKEFELTPHFYQSRLDIYNAFQWAASQGHIEVMKYLVKEFSLTVKDARSNNNLALRMAVENNQLEAVKYLIEELGLNAHDVQSLHINSRKKSPKKGHYQLMQYLKDVLEPENSKSKSKHKTSLQNKSKSKSSSNNLLEDKSYNNALMFF